jgi:HPr kinase/phosphorylase
VADDRVDIEDGVARSPPNLAGLLEVRGVGIVRLPHAESARLALVVELTEDEDRLPAPARDPVLQIALIRLNAALPSTPDRVAMALNCALGRVGQLAGAFEP